MSELGKIPSLLGQKIGNWHLECLLGEGGMSVVYAGRHAWLPQRGAVKVLRPEFCQDPFVLKRFEQEALTAGQLNHDNIIHVLDFGQSNHNLYFLVAELLEGADLESVVSLAPLPKSWILAVVEQVCSALQATHAANIIHRDLKPSNIFLLPGEPFPHVKLLDFGIAKMLGDEESQKLTRTGAIVGTPTYLAPEQVLPNEALTPAVDVYALGVILYQLFTGHLPLDGKTVIEHAMMLLQNEPPAVDTFRPALEGSEIAALIAAMLSKFPAQRPASMQEVLISLRVAVQSFVDPLDERSNYPVISSPEDRDGLAFRGHTMENKPATDEFLHASSETHWDASTDVMQTTPDGRLTGAAAAGDNPLPSVDGLLAVGDQPGTSPFRDANAEDTGLPRAPLPATAPGPHPPRGQGSQAGHSSRRLAFLFLVFLVVAAGVAAAVAWSVLRFANPAPVATKAPARKAEDPALAAIDRLALEGGKAFQTGKFRLAVRLWKRATRLPAWKRSKQRARLYRSIGLGLARQNLLHSATLYYQRYLNLRKSPQGAAQKGIQAFSLKEEHKKLAALQRRLQKRIQMGTRALASLRQSTDASQWRLGFRIYKDLLRSAPSVPSLHLKLARLLAPNFPLLSQQLVQRALKELEPDTPTREALEGLARTLAVQNKRRATHMQALLSRITKQLEKRQKRRAIRTFRRKLKPRRQLTSAQAHRLFYRWFRKNHTKHADVALSLLTIFRNKVRKLVRAGFERWLKEQDPTIALVAQLNNQLLQLRWVRKQKKRLASLRRALRQGKLDKAIGLYSRLLRQKMPPATGSSAASLVDVSFAPETLRGQRRRLVRARSYLRASHKWLATARFARAERAIARMLAALQGSPARTRWARYARQQRTRIKRAKHALARGEALLAQKRWKPAQRHFKRYQNLFPTAWNTKTLQKKRKICRCAIGGVPWENCSDVKIP